MIVEMDRRVCGPHDWIKTPPVGATKEQAEKDTSRLQPGKRYDLPKEVADMLLQPSLAEDGKTVIHPPAAHRPERKVK